MTFDQTNFSVTVLAAKSEILNIVILNHASMSQMILYLGREEWVLL